MAGTGMTPQPRPLLADFTDWAAARGVVLDGVAAVSIPGVGLGVVSTRDLKEGETIVFVPAGALVTTDVLPALVSNNGSISKHGSNSSNGSNDNSSKRNNVSNSNNGSISNNGSNDNSSNSKETSSSNKKKRELTAPPPSPPRATGHALIAAALATATGNGPRRTTDGQVSVFDGIEVWLDTWPSMRDFRQSLPVFWPAELLSLMPQQVQDTAKMHRTHMDNDWDSVVDSVYPDGSGLTGRGANGPETRTDDPARQAFDYFWLVVNTRSFYWDRSRPLNGASRASAHRDAKDCMALSPWADLFNHTDEGWSRANADKDGYRIVTTRNYRRGQEIHVNYGGHSNDFLLGEYGFILSSNTDDGYHIDAALLPRLTAAQTVFLTHIGYYRSYPAFASYPFFCFRTEVAVRVLLGWSEARVLAFAEGREFDEDPQRDDADGHAEAFGDAHKEETAVRACLIGLLDHQLDAADSKIASLKRIECGAEFEAAVQTGKRRWQQIRNILINATGFLKLESH